jgi:hypothetical protein
MDILAMIFEAIKTRILTLAKTRLAGYYNKTFPSGPVYMWKRIA